MKEKIQAPQGARPKVVPIVAWTFIIIGILAIGIMLMASRSKKDIQVQSNHVVVATAKMVPVKVAAPVVSAAQTITASVPPDNIAPITRAALERAGLHDVQFS